MMTAREAFKEASKIKSIDELEKTAVLIEKAVKEGRTQICNIYELEKETIKNLRKLGFNVFYEEYTDFSPSTGWVIDWSFDNK